MTAVIIATDEHLHVAPVLEAAAQGLPMMIEKPHATTLADSTRVLDALQVGGADAVVGYLFR